MRETSIRGACIPIVTIRGVDTTILLKTALTRMGRYVTCICSADISVITIEVGDTAFIDGFIETRIVSETDVLGTNCVVVAIAVAVTPFWIRRIPTFAAFAFVQSGGVSICAFFRGETTFFVRRCRV